MKLKFLQTFFFSLVFTLVGFSQESITSISQVYSQNFDGLAITGTTNTTLPANWLISRDDYRAGFGNSNTGDIYSFGADASTERALGSIASGGTGTLYYGISFINNTSATITSITVGYTGEMWRLGSTNLDSLEFAYAIGTGSLTGGTYTNVPQLNFITPNLTGLTTPNDSAARNGNDVNYQTNLSYTITGLSIAVGDTFIIRFQDNNNAGSDDGLAIDDLSVSFSGTVLPACTQPVGFSSFNSLTPTTTTVSGVFTKAADADKTMILYNTIGVLSTTPTDGITYSVGQTIGNGTIAYIGNGSSFTVGGLTPNTLYTFYAVGFNDNCTGGPNYDNAVVVDDVTTNPNPVNTTYYDGIDTSLYCADLKTELKDLLASTHTPITYADVLTAFRQTDVTSNDTILDRYAGCTNFIYTPVGCSSYSSFCDCYNRDHVVPQSWFGDDNLPMKTDMHHLFPSDGLANGTYKSNFPLGIASTGVATTPNGSKRGTSDALDGYTGTVFEPIAEYKGDFARAYLYFVTRYQDSIATFVSRNLSPDNALDDVSYTGLDAWILPILVSWHELDPPSQLEINRNDSVYVVQGNRNPYIDHPEWVERVFGTNGSACLPPCTEPDSVTGIDTSNVSETGFTIIFNQSQDADGYIALYRPVNQYLASVVDDSVYTVGQLIEQTVGSFTDTSYVAYIGTDTTFTMTSVLPNTDYYVVVMAYKNCPNGPNYTIHFTTGENKILVNTSTPSTCVEPDSVLSIASSNITATSFDITFGASANADGYVVVYRPNNSFVASVSDDSTYIVGQIIEQTSGSFTDTAIVAYIGTDTSVSLTGLDSNVTYNVVVFPYVNCPNGPNYTIYFQNTKNKIAVTTTSTVACAQADTFVTDITFTSVTNNSIAGTFVGTTPAADGYIVLYSTTSTVPRANDGLSFNVGDSVYFSTYVSVVAQIGTSTSFNITGLEEGTQYYVYIQPYTICSGVPDYSYRISTGNNKLDTTTLGGCPEPNSVTGINITNVSATSVTVNYTAPVGGADGYVILQGSSFLPALRDSNTYTVGQTVIQGTDTGIVAYVGTDTSVTISGLNPNTHYEFVVFAYSNCSYGENYKINFTLGTNKDSITTLPAIVACIAPTTQATVLTYSVVTADSIGGSFTATTADGYVVLYSISSTAPTLSDATTYTAGQTVGSATVVQSGISTNFSIGGLTANTTYYVFVYAYNNTACTGGPAYNTISPLSSDTTTALSTCVAPATQATMLTFNNVTTSSLSGSFTSTTADGYIVLYGTGATAPILSDGFIFPNGEIVDGATVVQSGTATTFTINGLTANTTYYVFVFAYNNTTCIGGPAYNNTTPLVSDTMTAQLACVAPTTQATMLTFNNVTTESINGSFTATTADGYVVLYSTSSTAPTLNNATTYTAGQTVGTATVVQSGTGTTFNISGLTANTSYYVFVYAYNNTACTGGPAYNTTSPLTSDTTTLATQVACVAPTTQATTLTFNNVTTNSLSGSFTATTADGYVVLYSTSLTAPTLNNATTYTAGQTVGSATVVQSGTSTTFNISGLTANTTYYVFVYAYNNTACTGGPAYNTTSPLTGNTTTALPACVAPTTQATTLTFNNVTTSSLSGNFTATTADGYVVLYSTSSTAPTLSNGTTYTAGQTVGSATVVQSGTSTTFSLSGLTANTTYYVFVYAYNNTACTGGPAYNTTSPLTGNTTTALPACVAPTTQATALTYTTITDVSLSGSFTATTADGYIVLYSASSTAPTLSDATTYTAGQTVGSATVVQSGTGTTFNISGLTANTTYYVFVYAYNNTACTGGPAYNTTSPLSSDTTTAFATGIKASKNTAFSVYPNPVATNGMVNIQFKTALIDDASLTVVDVLGRVISNIQIPVSTKSYNLSVENYSKGMYIINVQYKNENSAVPFIVE